ncbi:class I SAM-dependent methyltransferase [Rhodophyticola sp.]|uniref:class I SAM-dependent methyltransferase n=1 Tax=Rhodophyticola sp. TaxID=2680032 RepID=UPI003D282EAB
MVIEQSQLNERKANFSGVYNEKTPHAYFSTMRRLEYQIPENAKPQINAVIDQIKRQGQSSVSVLDLGCSYGVLSALIRFGLPLDTLYQRYRLTTASNVSDFSQEATWYADRAQRDDVRFYGIDISTNAINFAVSVGLLDAGVSVDLEDSSTSANTLSVLPPRLDLVVSTGCVGYITEVTFKKILAYLSVPSRMIT